MVLYGVVQGILEIGFQIARGVFCQAFIKPGRHTAKRSKGSLSHDEMGNLVRSEMARYSKIIQSAGIKKDTL